MAATKQDYYETLGVSRDAKDDEHDLSCRDGRREKQRATQMRGEGLERGVMWQQPDRRHAEAVQVVKPAHQTGEIANTVAAGIHIRCNREAIDDCILVPKVVDHRPALR